MNRQRLTADWIAKLDRLAHPGVTCPATRHAAMVAEAMLKGEFHAGDVEDQANRGDSIAATVHAAWSARRQLRKLGWTWAIDARGVLRWREEKRA